MDLRRAKVNLTQAHEKAVPPRSTRIRLFSIAGSAAVIAAAMWSAGIPNEAWFAWLHKDEQTPVQARVVADSVGAQPSVATAAKEDGQKSLHLVSTSPGRNASEGTAQLGAEISNPLTFG